MQYNKGLELAGSGRERDDIILWFISGQRGKEESNNQRGIKDIPSLDMENGGNVGKKQNALVAP